MMKFLGMKKTSSPIVVSPNKDNIRFSVHQADSDLSCLNWLVSMIEKQKDLTPYTIIFCQTVNDIVCILSFLLMKLGARGAYIDGEGPASKRRLLGVYYSQTPKSQKDAITYSFEGKSGSVRVIIASSSLSMGVDFPNVQYVIHYGPSRTLTGQLQEAGRAGRDGKQAFNIIYFLGKHLTYCEKEMKSSVRGAVTAHFSLALRRTLCQFHLDTCVITIVIASASVMKP